MVFTTSCSQKKIQTITVGEWLHLINDKAGISSYSWQTPYFPNIKEDNTYFSDVQSAVEWEILDIEHDIDLEQQLNKEWTAYTLINLSNQTSDIKNEVLDISQSNFQSQINTAISTKLLTVDSKKMFYPKKIMDKEEAIQLLEKVVSYINDRKITETKTNIQWKNKTDIIDIQPLSISDENQFVIVDPTNQYSLGQLIHYVDDGKECYYKVKNQIDDHLYLEDVDVLQYTKNMELSGTSNLNFEDARIEDESGEVLQEYSYIDPVSLLSTTGLQKTFHVSDYNVVISANSSYVKAEVNRTLPHGSTVYAYVKLNGAKVDYQWKSTDSTVNDAYFKVKFTSEEDFGVKNSAYKNLYGDFSKFDPNDFVTSVSKMYVEKKDVVESTLELCKVTLPIPNAPLMNITVSLNLNMHASGRVEVTMTQDSVIGCEIKNGNVRMIHEFDHSHSNRFKTTAGVSSGVSFGLNLTSVKLMDASLNAGAEASFKTSLHLYKDDEHDVISTDISTDVVDELSEGNPNVLVCSDLSANLVVYLKLNSAKTQLGKLGFTKRINLVKQSLLPKGKSHIENFHFVSKCTRTDREKKVDLDTLTVTKKIKLNNYSMVVHVNKAKTIEIIGLPEGYTKDDLIYTSSNEEVAIVDSNGNVIGKSSGSCVITISTSDEEHYIKSNVIVSEVGS